jgi:hypothetical protein
VKVLVVLAALVAFVWVAPAAQASTIAANFDNTTGLNLGNPAFTLGWSFTPTVDITVTDLGLFDSGQDGLVESHQVGLWNSSQTLLASTTVASGTSATLDDKFRFASIAGINLFAGQTYFIGALFLTPNDPLIFPGNATNFVTASDISFLNAQFVDGNTLMFPGGSIGETGAYFGPNFRFDSATVPEPASVLLFGTGLAPLVRRVNRRGRKS